MSDQKQGQGIDPNKVYAIRGNVVLGILGEIQELTVKHGLPILKALETLVEITVSEDQNPVPKDEDDTK